MAIPPNLTKLQITVEHTGEKLSALFNPEEYTLNKDVNFASQTIPGLSSPLLQFVNGNLRTLEMELFFDTWDTPTLPKEDVRNHTNRVIRLMEIDSQLHAPPIVKVSWASLQFRGVLARASQRFILFTNDGVPVRARLTVTFNEYVDPEREGKEVDRQTADFTKLHEVTQGETLALIAARHYGTPMPWRAIALANGLDDPRALFPGQQLRVPSLPFRDPETGEALR
jgi:LysM repeat protein